MRRRVALLVLSVALMATQAAASEQSEQLYSRGLVDFHAGRYQDALQLFEQAVHADPADTYALYYRGVTRGRLGDLSGAITDLRAVVAAKPHLEQAALDLGVALVQTSQYKAAVPWLEQAQRVEATAAKASLFLAVAQLHLDQYDAAQANLQRAQRDPELALAARYYEGIAAYRQGHWAEAEQHFGSVANTSPTSEMGREATAFLGRIRGTQRPSYQLYGSLGFQYDSNVSLAPSNEVIKVASGISKQSDGRVTIDAGGTWVPWHNEHMVFSLGYEFYQSLHFDLTNFNLQDHRPSAQLAVNAGPVQFGLLGRYDYYLLDTDSFLQEVDAVPWVIVPEGGLGRTELSYRMRRRDFIKASFRIRDAFNHAANFRQFFYLGTPDRYVSVGYSFDREDPVRGGAASNQFAYDGNEVNTGLGWAFPFGISAEIDYAFRHERYAPPSSGRRDEEHEIVFVARKRLTEQLDLTCGYLGTINNSNDPFFNYERHIGSLALEVRY